MAFFFAFFRLVLFWQSYNLRLGGSVVLKGALLGLLLSGMVAMLTFVLQQRLPYRKMLITTGVLAHEVAFDQGATGPIQRASGFDRDLRRDHPYAAYGDIAMTVPFKMTVIWRPLAMISS